MLNPLFWLILLTPLFAQKPSIHRFPPDNCFPQTDTLHGQQVLTEVQKKATFPGGMIDLIGWFGRNIRYPDGQEWRGIIHVTFIVDTLGHIHEPCIYNRQPGEYNPFELEALRVLGEMPPWTPAEH